MPSLKSCPRNSILRKGYTRRLKNKTIRVSSGCIKSQSQTGKKRSDMDMIKMTMRKKMHKYERKHFGTPHCKKGQIMREGYIRKSFTRKSGVHISGYEVAPKCIKATGLSKKRGKKGKQLFVLQKGELTKYGYHHDLSDEQRHDALKKALDETKPLSVYRKLIALYVLNKNTNPSFAAIYRNDADWVKTTPEYMKRKD